MPLTDQENAGLGTLKDYLEEARVKGWIHRSWMKALSGMFDEQWFQTLWCHLDCDYRSGVVFPPRSRIFRALETPFSGIRVVILGQDPYHGDGQADGLAFSVPAGVRLPPSLKNIYKELGIPSDELRNYHGDLSGWQRQGVMLLNTSLSVLRKQAASHSKIGWDRVTDRVLRALSRQEGLVFMLWGKHAEKRGVSVPREDRLVLVAGHPSPLSVRYFSGCRHFDKCNEYLKERGQEAVAWRDSLILKEEPPAP